MKPVFSLFLLLLSCQFIAGSAIAAKTAMLYNVDIPVADESTTTRYNAFRKGMNEVFIRISGDSFVMKKLKPAAASRYVKQFSYEPLDPPQENAEGEVLEHVLKIQYNGNMMMRYLLDNGFPVWGEHRSDVVIWLAVRDGQNQYVLKASDQSVLKETVDKALTRRGVPERWPLYDYKDRKTLTVADIRGGFRDPITKASKRYSRGPALAGSMIWNGSKWQSNWSLLMDGDDQYWNMVDTDYQQLVNRAIDRAADAMGTVYAVHEASKGQQLVKVWLDVQAITSVAKYRKVENYLSDLTVVESVNPLRVDATSAMFELVLRSDEQDLLKVLHNDAELAETAAVVRKPKALDQSKPDQSKPEQNGPDQTGSEQNKAGQSQPVQNSPMQNSNGQKSDGQKNVEAKVPDASATMKPGSEISNSGNTMPVEQAPAAQELPPENPVPVYYYKLIH